MLFGSICSGIEAASLAWEPLGWRAAFLSEIDLFPRAVLFHRYPNIPLHGDFTTIQRGDYEPINLLVGGTPCQSFSVAGLRRGLDDERGNLALEFIKLVRRLQPQWIVWENVPGVLSSNGGRDFGAFVGALVECGYGFAYRVLDAQNFGVAQRRRRVFVVGYLGDWRPPVAVLFEPESLRGNIKTIGKQKKNIAYGIASSTRYGIAKPLGAHALSKGRGTDLDNTTYIVSPIQEPNARTGRSTSDKSHGIGIGKQGDPMYTLQSGNQHGVAVSLRGRDVGATAELGGEVSPALRASQGGGDKPHVLTNTVRRLTPVECERLQGMPDNWTRIPWRGKPADKCPDGPRYKAIGNSMAVPVMRWIGERIALCQTMTNSDRSKNGA